MHDLRPDLRELKGVRLLGVAIHDLPAQSLVDIIADVILHHKKAIISNVNIYAMNIAYEQSRFSNFLNNSDIVFCDGFGVMLGARIRGMRIQHRYTPPDWIPLLAEKCVQHDLSFFFLGSRPGIAEQAAEKLCEKYPALRIAGTHHGYFDHSNGSEENESVLHKINASRPNILVLGFGMPVQEYWLEENWDKIDANVAIPAGALFDYLSGRVYRAPRWITDHGFEWLARLIVEPRRLWKRYVIGNPLFLLRVILERLGLLSFEKETIKR